jgi:hypothetical protein
VQPQLIRRIQTETFGSMTFILLLTRRSFGHSVKQADLSLVASDAPGSEDFLGFTCYSHLLSSLLQNLVVQPASSARRHPWAGFERVGERHV